MVNLKGKWMYNSARIIAGLGFVLFGAMKFVPQFQIPLPGVAGEFLAGMAASGYFIPFLGICEVIIGAMLLFNQWPALASVMMVPISLNILLFDVILMPEGWFVGVFPMIFNIYLLYYHWDSYKPMLKR
jgi:putative oxidoreductase